ncbi:MAG: SCO family protein [Candidatus Omnitrophica bacterium]|nr:SCO family protein [Candidatus Omnitrophota bacterium]
MKTRILSWLLFTLCLVGVTAVWIVGPRPDPSVPAHRIPVLAMVPDFTLLDQFGKPFQKTALDGSVWIADFIFTSCAGQCPEMTRQMVLLQEKLPPEVRLVSFSVDPTRDTPDLLRRYAEQNGARQERWYFLTGDLPAVRELSLKTFSFAFDDSAQEITHSGRFALVDKRGAVRGTFDSSDPDAMKQLLAQAKELAR